MTAIFTSLFIGLAVGWGLGAATVRRDWPGIVFGAAGMLALLVNAVTAFEALH